MLMFEFLAGYPPFYDDNPMAIYAKVVMGRSKLGVILPNSHTSHPRSYGAGRL